MSMKADREIGRIVRLFRIKKDFSQTEIALKLGYTNPQFVSAFERGLSKIPFQTIGELCVILELPEKKIIKILCDQFSVNLLKKIRIGRKYKVLK